MKILIERKTLLSIIAVSSIGIAAGVIVGTHVFDHGLPVGHGYNTVVSDPNSITSIDANIPPLGACTGPLGKSKDYLLQVQSENGQNPVPETLQHLDGLTITCNGPADVMKLPDNFTDLGGQCCGALKNVSEYNAHLAGLKQQFADISDVPKDPYEIPIAYAKKMMAYDQEAMLTSDQQSTLEQATKLSKEGGPCCCKCWHWNFNEGIAKKLIKEHSFSAQQVATFYDLSGICGV
jgi:hypothetical protein